jgi:glycosyltransferase involved in cell wall biosynthesis
LKSWSEKPKIAYVPETPAGAKTTERTPKLFAVLSERYDVVPIPTSRYNRVVYDQGIGRVARYLLFLVDEIFIFIATLLRCHRERARVVFGEGIYYSLAAGVAARVLDIPLVWDSHGNVRIFARALGRSRSVFLWASSMMERILERMCAAIVVVSASEKDSYVRIGFPLEKFVVVPTCADFDFVDRGTVESSEARRKLSLQEQKMIIFFFGPLSYYPNLEAARYIAEELSRAVRKEHREADFFIAGKGEMGVALPEGVHHLGFVPDLHLWLLAADICVAPMWRGVGILTKVIDMLSAGKPTVVTPLAVEGIPELEDGLNCVIARDKDEFKDALMSLIDNVELRGRIGRNGKALVQSKYSWDVVAPELYDVLDSLMVWKGRPK